MYVGVRDDADIAQSSELDEHQAVHARCGVYTKPPIVERLLDEIGWTSSNQLAAARLLEPACGDGAFVEVAARRLVDSFKRYGTPLTKEYLFGRIQAYELLESEAAIARYRALEVLLAAGVSQSEAAGITRDWVHTGDFLLWNMPPSHFTHVAGNPPYLRWARLPPRLKSRYEAILPRSVAKGDLFLPFLNRGIMALKPKGMLAYVCSDRWRHMAFARHFRAETLPLVEVVVDEELDADQAFVRSADVYPSILVLRRCSCPAKEAEHSAKNRSTLSDVGFSIRVGPALGCTPAFLVDPSEWNQPEPELLAPFARAADVLEGELRKTGLQLMCLHDEDGRLRNLEEYPRALTRLTMYRRKLEGRAIVSKNKAEWFRPIDRVCAASWSQPKILLPELARVPRVALDFSGAIPAHGVYAIFATSPNSNLSALYKQLSGGGLALALKGRAPKVKGGYLRCYKAVIESVLAELVSQAQS